MNYPDHVHTAKPVSSGREGGRGGGRVVRRSENPGAKGVVRRVPKRHVFNLASLACFKEGGTGPRHEGPHPPFCPSWVSATSTAVLATYARKEAQAAFSLFHLDSGPHRHDLVGVDSPGRRLSEERLHLRLHLRHARHTADQKNLIHVGRFPGVRACVIAQQ